MRDPQVATASLLRKATGRSRHPHSDVLPGPGMTYQSRLRRSYEKPRAGRDIPTLARRRVHA